MDNITNANAKKSYEILLDKVTIKQHMVWLRTLKA